MKKNLRIVMAQLNFTVGDIKGNTEKHLSAIKEARDEHKADLIVFPELSLTGYPPEDLLLRHTFTDRVTEALEKIISETKHIHCIIGYPLRNKKGLFNVCSLLYNGKIITTYAKQRLPNYGVFDEARYFSPGDSPSIITINDMPIGLIICEDLWSQAATEHSREHGARLMVIPNASPFEVNKHEQRLGILGKRAKQCHMPMIYVNTVGGQDELLFDGGSMVVSDEGELMQCAPFFAESLIPVDITLEDDRFYLAKQAMHIPDRNEKIYQALVLGLRDYIEKNHIPGVLVGASGGIDSALTLAIAVDALGPERVKAILMPSRFTHPMSLEDAEILANNLHIQHETISIEPAYNSFLTSLAETFAGKKPDVTEENIQARCRAILLMALSNKEGKLVLSTGNRSELAVGYCTLYGDMAGGFAPLKDVPKTLVYELAKYRNQINPIIPLRSITRPPSAELAPDQKDEDSLPPYAVLDKILECYLNESQSIDEIVAQGMDENVVIKIVNLIKRNEYKRRQGAIGTRINHKNFIKDWRYPVTNGFKM